MWQRVDNRLHQLAARAEKKKSTLKKKSLSGQLQQFLGAMPIPRTMENCTPEDLKWFLASKDESGVGRTQVHDVECPHLGQPKIQPCGCPRRLSADYVKHLISDLKTIMTQWGRGHFWNSVTESGNPAMSPDLVSYLASIREEQAESHVVVTQAVPMTMGKIVSLVTYLAREIDSNLLPASELYLFLRDRAFFLMQFLIGERGGDLLKLLLQEIYECPDNSGLILRQTFGKTRSEKHCVLISSNDKYLCPVTALNAFVNGAKAMGLDMSTGYVFRKTLKTGNVINFPMSQSAASQRLERHLSTIGKFGGETTHSLRGGLAVALQSTEHDPAEAASHIGWRSMSCWSHYSRAKSFQSAAVAQSITNLIANSDDRDRADTTYRNISTKNLSRAFS
jgi:hypothetical protein